MKKKERRVFSWAVTCRCGCVGRQLRFDAARPVVDSGWPDEWAKEERNEMGNGHWEDHATTHRQAIEAIDQRETSL